MAAMAPLGVVAFLDPMDFLAYLDCLYVPAQMWSSVVTKPGFAFCDIVGEATAKYLGRPQKTLSLLLELNFLIHLEDRIKILWIKSLPSSAAIAALDAAQDMGGWLGCKLTLAAFHPQVSPSLSPGLLSIQSLPNLNPRLGLPQLSCRVLHLMRFMWAHPSSLTRSL